LSICKHLSVGIPESVLGHQKTRFAYSALSAADYSLPDGIQSQVQALALNQLEALSEALLDFNSLNDLSNWLGTTSFIK
jgi:hypothetical protein